MWITSRHFEVIPLKLKISSADPWLHMYRHVGDKSTTTIWQMRSKHGDLPQLWNQRSVLEHVKRFSQWMAPSKILTWLCCHPVSCMRTWTTRQKTRVAFKSFWFLICHQIFFFMYISFSPLLSMLVFQSAASFAPDPTQLLGPFGPSCCVKVPTFQ